MSSTSREVCEVFNGKGVVRAMGTPKLTQFLLFPGEHRRDDWTCGLHTLETAYDSTPMLLQKGHFGVFSRWYFGDHEQAEETIILPSSVDEGMPSQTRRRRPWKKRQYRPLDEESLRDSGPTSISPAQSEKIEMLKQRSQPLKDSKPPFPEELKGSAPNLQLNLPTDMLSHKSSIKELWIAAAAAILIQLGIITICAAASYYPPIRAAVGSPQSDYAFSLFVSGTICLNFGMILCSWVIEQSTREHLWRGNAAAQHEGLSKEKDQTHESGLAISPITEEATNAHVLDQIARENGVTEKTPYPAKELDPSRLAPQKASSMPVEDRPQIHLFWLQQKHTVNDQDFDPYLILGGVKDEILTSSRFEHRRWQVSFIPNWLFQLAANKYELLTTCASLLGIVGFILQFEGLRSLAWPTAVAQLGAIFVMALIRALIRRRLGDPPAYFPALEGYELDWLALRLIYLDSPLEPPRGTGSAKPHALPTIQTHWRILTKPDKPKHRILGRLGYMDPEPEENASEALTELASDGMPTHLFPRESQMLLKIRRRLGHLTKCPGVASKEAVALSRAISRVLDEFWSEETVYHTFEWKLDTIVGDNTFDMITLQAKKEMESKNGKKEHCSWVIHSPDIDAILSLWMASYTGSKAGTAKDDDELSSDWLMKRASITVNYQRILGENPQNSEESTGASMRTDFLTRDLTWWVSDPRIPAGYEQTDETQTMEQLKVNANERTSSSGPELIIGFNGVDGQRDYRDCVRPADDGKVERQTTDVGTKKGPTTFFAKSTAREEHAEPIKSTNSDDGFGVPILINSNAPLATILAHHLFSAFMWAISELIPSDSFHEATVEDSDQFIVADFERSWGRPTLRNRRMMKIVRDIERFGLGSTEDILLSIIPPLSTRGILPNEKMVDLLLEKAKGCEPLHDWQQASEIYKRILDLHMDPRRGDRISYVIVVELIEFLFLAKEAVDDRKDRGDPPSGNKQARSLTDAVTGITERLLSHTLLLDVVQKLRWFYGKQCRQRKFNSLFPQYEIPTSTPTAVKTQKALELPQGGGSDRAPDRRSPAKDISTPTEELFSLVKFSIYHSYATMQSAQKPNADEIFKKKENLAADPDIFGWSPLHYATVGDDNDVFKRVRQSSEPIHAHHELLDKSGRTPLHYAAMYKPKRIEELADTPEALKTAASVKGRDGTLPIHCAARYDMTESIEALIPYLSPSLARDAFGRSPLHLGTINGHRNVVKRFLNDSAALVQCTKELSERTALHLALQLEQVDIAEDIISQALKLEILNTGDSENMTPIKMVFTQGKADLLDKILAKFPKIDHYESGQETPGQVATNSPNDPAQCFVTILRHGIRLKRRMELETLLRQIVEHGWAEGLIFEAFRFASGEGHLDMLMPLLKAIDSIVGTKKRLDGAAQDSVSSDDESRRNNQDSHEEKNQDTQKNETSQDTQEETNQESNSTLSDRVRECLRNISSINTPNLMIWAIQNGQNDFKGFIQEFMQLNVVKEQRDMVTWNGKDSGNRSPLAWLAKVKPDSKFLTPQKRKQILTDFWESWQDDQKVAALNERQGKYGKTPLIYALKNGLEELAESFIDAKADIGIADDNGESAFSYSLKAGRDKLYNRLIEIDPDIVNEKKGPWNTTPLIDAVSENRTGVVDILSNPRLRTDPNLGDKEGDTPLTWCVLWRNEQMVEHLLEKFPTVDPNKTNDTGGSPLLYAGTRTAIPVFQALLSSSRVDPYGYDRSLLLPHLILEGSKPMVEEILKFRLDLTATDDAGRSIISLAAIGGNPELFSMVRESIQKLMRGTGDSPDSTLSQLQLAFHACAQGGLDGHEKIVDKLIEDGVHPDALDRNGWTVFECARQASNNKMEHKLRHWGSRWANVNPPKPRFPTCWATKQPNYFFEVSRYTTATLSTHSERQFSG